MSSLQVINRHGNPETVQFDVITNRIRRLAQGFVSNTNAPQLTTLTHVDPVLVSQQVVVSLFNGCTTSQLDDIAACVAYSYSTIHTDYGILAARIAISNLHKATSDKFSECVKQLYNHVNCQTGQLAPMVNKLFATAVQKYACNFDSAIDSLYDYDISYVGIQTLKRSFLLTGSDGTVYERPGYMFFRTAVQLSLSCSFCMRKHITPELLDQDALYSGPHPVNEQSSCPRTCDKSGSRNNNWDALFINQIVNTYRTFALMKYTHATPTIQNAGTIHPQLASCFLLDNEDSLEDIIRVTGDISRISCRSGGMGLNISQIRAAGARINGSGGKSNGIIPLTKVYETLAMYVDQGGGKRKGGLALYLEPWHLEIESFLDLRLENGAEHLRARNIFTALWIPDLFMRRFNTSNADTEWVLFCPSSVPKLLNKYGNEFDLAYEEYERIFYEQKKHQRTSSTTTTTTKTVTHNNDHGDDKVYDNEKQPLLRGKIVKIQELWLKMITSLMETGTPYLLFKDAANMMSNQKNLGYIKHSNLCTEIIQYSDKHETAVCNLASVCLPKFVKKSRLSATNTVVPVDPIDIANEITQNFDFDDLSKTVQEMVWNLNNVIDINEYPDERTEKSNKSRRPMGLGVQGLADVFFLMNIPFDSEAANILNHDIFEVIYYNALVVSNQISKISGIVYQGFEGSPISKGMLKMDLYHDYIFGDYRNDVDHKLKKGYIKCDFDFLQYKGVVGKAKWSELRENILKYGLYNSLLVAPMPTATTSNIMGCSPCFEPYVSNLFTVGLISGDYTMINSHLVHVLDELRLWNENTKQEIIQHKGSIQKLSCLNQYCANPIECQTHKSHAVCLARVKHIKSLFRTVWEIKQSTLVRMAATRAPYIDQSQSLNIFKAIPKSTELTKIYLYGWACGLIGFYYLRSDSAADPLNFTSSSSSITTSSSSPVAPSVLSVSKSSTSLSTSTSIKFDDDNPLLSSTTTNISTHNNNFTANTKEVTACRKRNATNNGGECTSCSG